MRHGEKSKRIALITTIVGFRFAIMLAACAPSDRASEITLLEGDLDNGLVLYDSHCAECHGPNGDDGPSVNLLRQRIVSLSPAEHADIIIERMEQMGRRSNRISLTDQEIADIIAIVRDLQGLDPDWSGEN